VKSGITQRLKKVTIQHIEKRFVLRYKMPASYVLCNFMNESEVIAPWKISPTRSPRAMRIGVVYNLKHAEATPQPRTIRRIRQPRHRLAMSGRSCGRGFKPF
jgi:hypothetical protein